MENKILEIVNSIIVKKDKSVLATLMPNTSLRNDLGFDSLDLAEFTVKIEDIYDVDIFENGIVDTISEVVSQIQKGN